MKRGKNGGREEKIKEKKNQIPKKWPEHGKCSEMLTVAIRSGKTCSRRSKGRKCLTAPMIEKRNAKKWCDARHYPFGREGGREREWGRIKGWWCSKKSFKRRRVAKERVCKYKLLSNEWAWRERTKKNENCDNYWRKYDNREWNEGISLL